MPLDDAPGGGQADAQALEMGRAMQALERLKQLVRAAHVKARPVVADMKLNGVAHLGHAELDQRAGTD